MKKNDGGGEPNQGILQTYIEITINPPGQFIYAYKNVFKN
jgi:hypothetical protein